MSTSGCCLAVFPGWGSQESHPVYRLSNGLQTHYQQCSVAIEACRLHHISTVSATTANSTAGECRSVFICVYVSVCVCAQQREKSGCTKGMADPVLHGVSFLKLEHKWLATEFTDRLKLHVHGSELLFKYTAVIYSVAFKKWTAITTFFLLFFCSIFLFLFLLPCLECCTKLRYPWRIKSAAV